MTWGAVPPLFPQCLGWTSLEGVAGGRVFGTKSKGHPRVSAQGRNFKDIDPNMLKSLCAGSFMVQNNFPDRASHCFSAHVYAITNPSCSYVDRRQLDCVSGPVRGRGACPVTQRPGHLKDTNGPFCTFKTPALLTNKGQCFPLGAHRSPRWRLNRCC